jgi:hypothetical protein
VHPSSVGPIHLLSIRRFVAILSTLTAGRDSQMGRSRANEAEADLALGLYMELLVAVRPQLLASFPAALAAAAHAGPRPAGPGTLGLAAAEAAAQAAAAAGSYSAAGPAGLTSCDMWCDIV